MHVPAARPPLTFPTSSSHLNHARFETTPAHLLPPIRHLPAGEGPADRRTSPSPVFLAAAHFAPPPLHRVSVSVPRRPSFLFPSLPRLFEPARPSPGPGPRWKQSAPARTRTPLPASSGARRAAAGCPAGRLGRRRRRVISRVANCACVGLLLCVCVCVCVCVRVRACVRAPAWLPVYHPLSDGVAGRGGGRAGGRRRLRRGSGGAGVQGSRCTLHVRRGGSTFGVTLLRVDEDVDPCHVDSTSRAEPEPVLRACPHRLVSRVRLPRYRQRARLARAHVRRGSCWSGQHHLYSAEWQWRREWG